MPKKAKPVITKTETAISASILLLLIVIAVGVFLRQSRFNPAVLSHQQLAAKQTQETVDPDLANSHDTIPLPEGMKPLTPAEVFTPETLYEKIDGKAELYLSAGFQRLRCQRITLTRNPDLWMEVFIYQMKTSSNAFSVFSMQRRENALPTELSEEFSYQTENAVFLAQGPYYMEVIGSQAGPVMQQAMLSFLSHFTQGMASRTEPLSEFSRFPDICSDQSRMSVIPSSAFGFDKFDNVYTSRCMVNGKEILVFLSNRNAPEQATQLADAYKTFLTTFGGKEIPLDRMEKDARLIEIFDTYELFFPSGNYLYGVHEAGSKEEAVSAGTLLMKKAGEATP